MRRIEYAPKAKEDVLHIAKYIAEQSQDRATAFRLLDVIDEKLHMLAQHPHSGHERPDLGDDVRSFPIGQYIMFYKTVSQGIQLIRILHSSRDIPRIFWL